MVKKKAKSIRKKSGGFLGTETHDRSIKLVYYLLIDHNWRSTIHVHPRKLTAVSLSKGPCFRFQPFIFGSVGKPISPMDPMGQTLTQSHGHPKQVADLKMVPTTDLQSTLPVPAVCRRKQKGPKTENKNNKNIKVSLSWIYPPPSNSHQQDYHIFSRETL